MRHMNSEFYEYILRERDVRDGRRTNADEDKDDSMCASLPHTVCTRPPSPPAAPSRGGLEVCSVARL